MNSSDTEYHLTKIKKNDDLLKGIDAIAYKLYGRFRYHKLIIKKYIRLSNEIDTEAAKLSDKSDEWIRNKLSEYRPLFLRYKKNIDNKYLKEVLGLLQESFYRVKKIRPYIVQIAGALALYDGYIVEMATGEGKTVTASLAAVLFAWMGRTCHVITANDYLASRDAEYLSPFYQFCYVSAGCVTSDMQNNKRAEGYSNDITYTTAKEVTADFLRDRIELGVYQNNHLRLIKAHLGENKNQQNVVMAGIYTVIVDEADNILIDEAVTPLIISRKQPDDLFVEACKTAYEIAAGLKEGEDYSVNTEYKEIDLSGDIDFVINKFRNKSNVYINTKGFQVDLLKQALIAREFYHRNIQYVIENEKIIIVDESTGRKMPQRTWSAGLHQMIEAKEGVALTPLNVTIARLSFQRFFRFYQNFAGMTGTAKEAALEFWHIYNAPVITIPHNRPNRQDIYPLKAFRKKDQKWDAIVQEVCLMHDKGRPVLIGTRNIENSEYLAHKLYEQGIKCQTINAIRHKEEASVIAEAGKRGAVTVATNMAGRGTDIKIDDEVNRLGGLHVIASECHESGRIDRQLFGRSARQGNNGSARAFISLEDELVLRYLPSYGRYIIDLAITFDSSIVRNVIALTIKVIQFIAQKRAYQSRCAVQNMDTWLDDSLSFTLDNIKK